MSKAAAIHAQRRARLRAIERVLVARHVIAQTHARQATRLRALNGKVDSSEQDRVDRP